MPRTWSRARALSLARAACLASLAACGDTPAEGGALYPALTLWGVEPTVVLAGSTLVVSAEGLVPSSVARYVARFDGRVGASGTPVGLEVSAALEGGALIVAVPDALVAAAAGSTFEGALTIVRDADDPEGDDEATRALSLQVRQRLTPFAVALEAGELHPGDRVRVRGGDVLLGDEGTTLVRLDGVFAEDAGGSRAIEALFVPVDVAESPTRAEATFTLTPDLLGIRPGALTGELRFVNLHRDGVETISEPLAVGPIPLRPPALVSVSPLAASRGQRITVEGRGLLPSDGLLQTATIFLLEGVFEPRRGLSQLFEGPSAVAIYPDHIEGNTLATAVLRTFIDADGRPAGLGAIAGRFVGRLTPLVLAGPDAVAGAPLPFEFEVLNPRQVVHIQFLPGFATALARFGLLAERPAIEARILEVVARDYAGINIAFSYETPSDHAEYTIVEVGGADPNGTGLFGLDNTEGKDVGNLRFDDVIGGFNAETRAGNFAAYGGIFVAELIHLSPTLGASELASPRFDDIFAPVLPELGGNAARVGESARFDERGAAIVRAARVLGNLIGSTITHEVGHSLGLTAIEGRYHNEGDTPNAIMDAGQFRPFEERAEIDGQGPAVFEPFNRLYLESILPLDPESPP
ncbi:MAG: hypothetical protein IT385_27580 [Deltaproteobacteria bacterium]|nr:hypothetical protein [Deltaproteobacteria bacterium]